MWVDVHCVYVQSQDHPAYTHRIVLYVVDGDSCGEAPALKAPMCGGGWARAACSDGRLCSLLRRLLHFTRWETLTHLRYWGGADCVYDTQGRRS